MAGALLVVALAEIMLTGRLTLIPPAIFSLLLAIALATLFKSLHSARGRGEVLSRQAAQLQSVAARLEASLANAATIPEFPFKPGLHVNYAEKVLTLKDGLPKFKDMPKEMGGSGVLLAE